MTGPPPTKRTLMMVEAYKAGGTLREIAEQFGVTVQRVHHVVNCHEPEAMRPRGETRFPSVGKPGMNSTSRASAGRARRRCSGIARSHARFAGTAQP